MGWDGPVNWYELYIVHSFERIFTYNFDWLWNFCGGGSHVHRKDLHRSSQVVAESLSKRVEVLLIKSLWPLSSVVRHKRTFRWPGDCKRPIVAARVDDASFNCCCKCGMGSKSLFLSDSPDSIAFLFLSDPSGLPTVIPERKRNRNTKAKVWNHRVTLNLLNDQKLFDNIWQEQKAWPTSQNWKNELQSTLVAVKNSILFQRPCSPHTVPTVPPGTVPTVPTVPYQNPVLHPRVLKPQKLCFIAIEIC
jgi:hypothetical protein